MEGGQIGAVLRGVVFALTVWWSCLLCVVIISFWDGCAKIVIDVWIVDIYLPIQIIYLLYDIYVPSLGESYLNWRT